MIIPNTMTAYFEMKSCFVRLSNFLLLEDIEELQLMKSAEGNEEGAEEFKIEVGEAAGDIQETPHHLSQREPLVWIEDGCFCWVSAKLSSEAERQASFQLLDVNLRIFPGEFIAIVGSVGSGKSSLLSAMIG